jgi:serine/threonine protein kinase
MKKIEENQSKIREKVYLHIFNNCKPNSAGEKDLINKIDEELKEWIKLPYFEKDDYGFCSWLKKVKGFNFNYIKDLNNQEIDSLKEKYSKYLLKEKDLYEKYVQKQEEDLQELGKITLKKLIGLGAYGQVYQGIWHDQIVAVKKIPTNDPRIINKEIKVLKSLNNENIIQYFGELSKDGNAFIIMEFAEQGSLNYWIEKSKNNSHDWQLNFNFINQIVKGLIYLHKNKILHRDLKSPNVLICNNKVLKLADFGLVKFLDSSNLSISGNKLIGTARWMAPESLRGNRHSYQSDIYSLGMVIWEIIAKETLPFKQFNNDFVIIFNVGGNGLREEIPTNTPEELTEIINSCWQENPQERISLAEINSRINKMIIWEEKTSQLEAEMEVMTN